MTGILHSFGRASAPTRRVIAASDAIARLTRGEANPASLLAYGNGRSYGDSCQNVDGALVDMRPMNRILAFNREQRIIEAEAGAMLSDIIAATMTEGLFPCVVPGTRFVTLGGAIANDVHGKNHHRRGTFGCSVEWLKLLRSDGKTLRCSRTENGRLFSATIGGMGLTGLIVSAGIRLMRVGGADVIETATPFETLDGYFDLAENADANNEYAVAWLDQLAGGDALGRGVLLTGNHVEGRETASAPKSGLLSVPFQPPVTVLTRPAIAAFNAAYRWSKSRNRGPRRASWESFFFPLDSVRDWNRLYGPSGLFQHQSVLPSAAARDGVAALLKATHRAGQASFLTVLKRFGDVASPGLLSFPRPGYTLTLDFPNRGKPTLDLLSELDAITVAAGGAVNPYKDARMSAETFAASFPNWMELEALRDPAFISDFWKRTAGRLSSNSNFAHAAE
jgi:FAD/FMN-containing dehydrogenase